MKNNFIFYGLMLLGLHSPALVAQVTQADQSQTNEESDKNDEQIIKKPESDTPKSQKRTSDKDTKAPKDGKNQSASKVFIPTEEISEDKPVAFPVDI